MCFHSKQSKKAQNVEKRFNAKVDDPKGFLVSDHIKGFSFPKTPVILNERPDIIQNINWGLIPSWSNDNEIRKFTLNAKVETLTEKPSFKNVVNNRCLIVATGFYEWQWQDKKGKNKKKHLITVGDDELFAFGGIWSEWKDVITGRNIKTYSIVTTEAKGLLKRIHNSKERMPVILTDNTNKRWLDGADMNEFINEVKEVRATCLDIQKLNLFSEL